MSESLTSILIRESLWTILLFIWVIIVVHPLTKKLYEFMTERKNVPHNKAIYYNRKVIHMLAGGIAALAVYLLDYKTPWTIIPMVVVLFFAVYLPHKTGKLMYWFQDPENMNEVTFVVMWGLVMVLSWLIFNGDWRYGVLPVMFMSFGDGITGIIRNMMYHKRTKSWVGNLAMMAFCIPVGFFLFRYAGALAGLVSSIIEHFEIHEKIDDNITVPVFGFVTLMVLLELGLG